MERELSNHLDLSLHLLSLSFTFFLLKKQIAENIHIVKAMFFPVVMYRCDSWTINKAENQRIDAFELWC